MEIIVRCTKMYTNETEWEEPKGSYTDFDIVKHNNFSKFLKRTKVNWPVYAQTIVDDWNMELSDYWHYQIIAINE